MKKLAIITGNQETMHCYAENDHVFIVGKSTFGIDQGYTEEDGFTREELDRPIFIARQAGSNFEQRLYAEDFEFITYKTDLSRLIGLKGEFSPKGYLTIGTVFGIDAEVEIVGISMVEPDNVVLVAEGEDTFNGNGRIKQYLTWTDFSMNY